jgi:hypothetical protein
VTTLIIKSLIYIHPKLGVPAIFPRHLNTTFEWF